MHSPIESDWIMVGNLRSHVRRPIARPNRFSAPALVLVHGVGVFEPIHDPDGSWSWPGVRDLGAGLTRLRS